MNTLSAVSRFPNATAAIAELRPHSQTIHLHSISSAMVADAVLNQRASDLAPQFGTIAHEMTHWLDLVGTVWGQQYLIGLFDCYEAALRQSPNAEANWWRVVRQYDEDRRVMFPQYYRFSVPDKVPHSPRHPWSIDYSCGQEFAPDGRIDQTRPIFMVRFGNHGSRELIARQPISVGTLLETNAVWCELITQTTVLHGVRDPGERKVSLALFSQERVTTLYDRRLTEYTAPVHLLSVQAQTKDAMLSYHAGSALAHVCLNLIDRHFNALVVPATFAKFGQGSIDAFRTAHDRGFAFACIAFNAPRYDDSANVDTWLASALRASGLPPLNEINNDARDHLQTISQTLDIRWRLDEVRNYLLETGRNIFNARREFGSKVTLMALLQRDIPLPPMFDAEGKIFQLGRGLDGTLFNPETMFDREWDLRKFCDNFLTACRVAES